MTTTEPASRAVRALLEGAIDYAGLFPPANLDLTGALAEYFAARSGDDSWALGRFVIPAERLSALHPSTIPPGPVLHVTALIGTGTADDVDTIERFNREMKPRALVDAVEAKAPGPGVARAVLAALPAEWTRYLEVAPGPGLEETLDLIAARGAFAKVRTGGVTSEAIPDPELLLDFLEGVVRRCLPFKATAGLHHPIRGDHPLTYAPESPRGMLYGYLNLFGAAAELARGGFRDSARSILLATDPDGFAVLPEGMRLGGETFSVDDIESLRRLARGFGSCSFREPVDELAILSPA